MEEYIKSERILLCRIQELDSYDGSHFDYDRIKYDGCGENCNSQDCNGITYGYVNTIVSDNIKFKDSGKNIHIETMDEDYKDHLFQIVWLCFLHLKILNLLDIIKML